MRIFGRSLQNTGQRYTSTGAQYASSPDWWKQYQIIGSGYHIDSVPNTWAGLRDSALSTRSFGDVQACATFNFCREPASNSTLLDSRGFSSQEKAYSLPGKVSRNNQSLAF